MRDVGFDGVVRLRFSGQKAIEPTDIVMSCDYSSFAHEPMFLFLFVAGLQKTLKMQGIELDISKFNAAQVMRETNAPRKRASSPRRKR
jgi:hypothetical protein